MVLKVEVQDQSGSLTGSSGGRLLGCRLPTSGCALAWQKEWGTLWGIFNKGTNPIPKGSTLMTYSPPQGTEMLGGESGVSISCEVWKSTGQIH